MARVIEAAGAVLPARRHRGVTRHTRIDVVSPIAAPRTTTTVSDPLA